MIPKKTFASLLVMTVAEFLQLSPFRRKLIFSQFSDKSSMNYLRGMQLYHLLKHTELTEGVSQIDQLFIDLLNEAQVGNIDGIEKLLKERFTQESDKNCPKNALDIYAENKPDMKMNKAILNDLPVEFMQ